MSYAPIPILFLLFSCTFAYGMPACSLDSLSKEPPWEYVKTSNGIKIYTRKIKGWDIKEYKAVFYVKASLQSVEKVLRDTPNQGKWSKNTLLSKEIKHISRNEFYTYSQTDSPWPASDRDNVVHIKYSYPSPQKVLIHIKSVPNFIPLKEGYVRIKRMKGLWTLKETKNKLVKVVQQAVVDPGGSAPSWLINSFLVDGPLKNLNNLRNYIEGQN